MLWDFDGGDFAGAADGDANGHGAGQVVVLFEAVVGVAELELWLPLAHEVPDRGVGHTIGGDRPGGRGCGQERRCGRHGLA